MTQKQDEGERREIPTGHTAMRQILTRFTTNHCSEPNDASRTHSFICEVDLPCYFWEETQKLGTRCAGCFPVPPRIFQGKRQDQGVPLQTTSRSKGFDWAELLRVRYPVASLASTCFALLQLELARSKCGGMRHCAASRPRHEGISTVLQTLPTDYRAAGKQGTKARATGQIVSLVLDQC